MVGYFPMAVAFGLLFGDVALAFLSGTWVFAGASQFLSVKLFQDHASLIEIWVSTFFLNLRHIFYSLHFMSRYRRFPFWSQVYSVFALTDETYAVLAHHRLQNAKDDAGLVWRVSFLNQATWVIGCVTGAALRSVITLKVKGLDFFLVALFVVLLVEQLKKRRDVKPLAFACFVGVSAAATGHPLWLFWAMAACVLGGIFLFPAEVKHHG